METQRPQIKEILFQYQAVGLHCHVVKECGTQTLASLVIATSQAFSAEQSPTVSGAPAPHNRTKRQDIGPPAKLFHVQQAGSACPPGSMAVANCRNGRCESKGETMLARSLPRRLHLWRVVTCTSCLVLLSIPHFAAAKTTNLQPATACEAEVPKRNVQVDDVQGMRMA